MQIEPMVFLGCWIKYRVKAESCGGKAYSGYGYVSGVGVGAPGSKFGTRLFISETGDSDPYGWDFELFQDDIEGIALLPSPPR